MTMSIEASNYQDIWIIRGFLNLQRNGWKSVPQFGGWEQNNHADPTSYTVVFTQARANRKQNKTDLTEFKRNSLGNEQELMAAQAHHDHHHHSDDSVTVRLLRSFLSDYQRYCHFLVQHEHAFLIYYISNLLISFQSKNIKKILILFVLSFHAEEKDDSDIHKLLYKALIDFLTAMVIHNSSHL